MKESVLVLSTAHMPNTGPAFGDLRAIPFEYGFVVWVEEPCCEIPWLDPIINHAWNDGYTLILFDAAGTKTDQFTSWDW